MTIETDADRAAFLADFGVSVTGAASFRAIYDHEYVEFADVAGNKPILAAPYADVSNLVYGNALTIDSTDYTVVRVENDGTGWAVVVLEES